MQQHRMRGYRGSRLRPIGVGRVGGTVQAWSPLNLTGLVLWLKADGTLWQKSDSTLASSGDGDPVGSWADASGAGNNVVQAADAKRPTLKLSVQNGLPAVRFDGVDDYLAAAIGQPSQVTWFVVYRGRSGTGSVYSVHDNLHRPLERGFQIWPDGNILQISGTSLPVSAVLESVWDYSGQAYSVTVDGTPWGSDTLTRVAPANEIILGAVGSTTPGEFLTGDLCEIIVCSSLLSAANRTLARDYLNARWGVY